ncbi:cation channel family protein, putative (macronuclear) [Tetrahymena thermophila SB210]|uniref:Cation channel family protein, putative n=1 Tax=Tetrahymena thermophila (strain SB210) TaxID=312017 RepID=Q23BV7_TETTS|nr:cation channel family protein, putative [Tetrahymena thermophila SB210]EAR94011.3 cation channel family protein, putative [Tetrahymena thermophila SB210]|eukprot:XP_001014256.3 cation channel family protein, putative [Tetrahymena thermophila SB210]
MQNNSQTHLKFEQNRLGTSTSFDNHMVQLKFNSQDHDELNEINKKKHDTEIMDQSCRREQQIRFKDEQKHDEIQISIFDQSIANNECLETSIKPIDKEKKKTLAQLRIQRIKFSRQLSQDQLNFQKEENINKSTQQLSQFVNKDLKSKKEPLKIMLALNLLVSVKSFYRQVTKNTRIFQRLTEEQHEIIGDVVSVYHKNSTIKSKRIQQFLTYFNYILYSKIPDLPTFSPNGLLKTIWDLLNAFLIVALSFIMSLQLFFTLEANEFMQMYKLSLIGFIIDILLNLNTQIFLRGVLIKQRKKIIFIYLKQKLIFDLLGILPLVFCLMEIQNVKYSFLLFLLKWLTLSQSFERMIFYLNYQKNLRNVVDFGKLILLLCIICHVFCGFWHYIAIYEIQQGYDQTWLHKYYLEEASVFTRYVYSFYFLAVTMITVGYGDITPQNSTEIIFTILTMFVTGMTWGFSISKIGNIIDNIEKKEKSYKESMQVIHTLMREENIRSDFRDQISNYLKYIYNESNEVQKQQEQKVIEKLSNQLRFQLISEIQGQYLENIPFIKNMELKQKIIFLMEECLYSPGEIIFQENNIDDCALFYIVKGEVEIIRQSISRNREDSIIQVLQKSSYFGEISFITGQIRNLTAKAADFCRIYKINREKFLNLIRESNRDYEEYVMIRDNIIFKNNYSIINQKCFHCQSEEHFSMSCPKTHLIISKKGIAHRYCFSVPHLKRQIFSRRNKQLKWKTRISQKRLYQAVYQINDNEDFFEVLNEIEQQAKPNKSLIYENDDTFQSSECSQEEDNKHEDQNKIQRRSGLRKVKIKETNETIQEIQPSNTNISNQSSYSSLNNKNNADSSQQNENQMSNSIVFQEQIRSIQKEISNIQNILQGEDGSLNKLTSIKESCQYIPSQCKIQDKQLPSSFISQQYSRKDRKSLSVGLCHQQDINEQNILQFNQQQQQLNLQQQQQQNYNQQLQQQNYHQLPDSQKISNELNSLLSLHEPIKNQISQLSQFNERQLSDSPQSNKYLKHSILKIKTRSISRLDNNLEQKDQSRQNSHSSKMQDLNQQDSLDQVVKGKKKQRRQSNSSCKNTQYNRQDSLYKIGNTPYQTQIKLPQLNNEKHQNIENSYFMLQHFDKGQVFKYYYPKHNYTKILKLLKKMQVSITVEKNIKNRKMIKQLSKKQEFKSSSFSPFAKFQKQND